MVGRISKETQVTEKEVGKGRKNALLHEVQNEGRLQQVWWATLTLLW